MSSDSGRPDDDAPLAGTELVLEVRLAPGDPLRGTIRARGRSGVSAFSGWIGFMSALNTLRAAADSHPDRP